MQRAEEVDVLRDAYEQALIRYEAICSSLNRHALAGTRPSDAELQVEKDVRIVLDATRRLYLQAWVRC